jgi:hypothetical protein
MKAVFSGNSAAVVFKTSSHAGIDKWDGILLS